MRLHHDMANNIVRWMKTKFNGYRPFAVISNEFGGNRLSDTEMLLRQSRCTSEESFRSHTQKRQHSSEHDYEHLEGDVALTMKEKIQSGGKRPLKLDELECDVSLGDCDPSNGGGQRQEFCFTLYDFDGHGKITKDDIASLVKTIYETLGQSVTVPHYGSKTIKVKLTVSPEKKVCTNNDEISSPTVVRTREVSGGVPMDNKWRSDLHSSKTREQRRKYRQERIFRRRRRSISSSGLSEDREADVSEDDDTPLDNKLPNRTILSTEATTIFSKYKRRSSLFRRKELMRIIQDNMDKNRLCFHSQRKPWSNDVLVSPHHRHRGKTTQSLSKNLINHLTDSVQPEKCDNNKMFLTSFDAKNKSGSSCSRRLHQRSHSFDSPCTRHSVNEEMAKSKRRHPTSHELKHRFRDFEQARAKEQVVRWLEEDFSNPAKPCNHRRKNNNLNNSKLTSKEDAKSKSRSCPHDKYEHRHVHEHVHHHYHHYRDRPILV